MFLLIESLLAANSASGKTRSVFWILFAGLFDTMVSSDSPHPLIPTVWLIALKGRSNRIPVAPDNDAISPLASLGENPCKRSRELLHRPRTRKRQ